MLFLLYSPPPRPPHPGRRIIAFVRAIRTNPVVKRIILEKKQVTPTVMKSLLSTMHHQVNSYVRHKSVAKGGKILHISIRPNLPTSPITLRYPFHRPCPRADTRVSVFVS